MIMVFISFSSDLLSNLRCGVKDNRGNSTILIGPRASGKSTLIKQIIEGIVRENSSSHKFEIVNLQGLIFSDTISVLKYLLSKFANGQDQDKDIESEFMAFDQLTALIKQFFVSKKPWKYLIFVLEDLERFASHPQQNLLYCLFELSLSLPVFVLGTSCRIDVLELLEKRVKSRFSQNLIYLPLPATKNEFIERIKTNLLIENELVYNEIVNQFIKNDGTFNQLCSFHFDLSKDVRKIFRILSVSFSSIPNNFDWSNFSEHFNTHTLQLSVYPSVFDTITLMELMIIVSMCRLSAKFPSTPVTFDVMVEELISCKQRATGLEHFKWTRSILQVAFDRLINCRLLLFTSFTTTNTWTDRSYLTVRLGLPLFIVLDCIEKHALTSKEVFALACEKF